ncbi:histone transcription regulator HIRA, WD repeat superfamily [Scheffersomyces coipomensis]|uniref:histone transcription regulator HIRA, WD repeat superfamily n=1 Tax=Scheffersomyces coipomensis TaxID=1788519 RepID=UPI00315D81C4
MKYLKFPTIQHGGEIHSIQINNDDTKILTSGKDHLVNVWNYDDYVGALKATDDKQLGEIKPIESFDYHSSLVSIAKWSPLDPNIFISSDIDGHLYLNDLATQSFKLIYPFEENSSLTAIVDLSWNPDSQLIAFSTGDGKVHILDLVKQTYQELSSLVHLDKLTIQRSIAFDPLNDYLITLGDDTLIYMYQYKIDPTSKNYQFRLLNKISRLINKNPINVNYKRISWSPEGELVSVPTASKNQVSLISLISRSKSWQNKVSLVGHGLTCEVVKFNPKIFQTENNVYYIMATAGADKILSVWNSTKDTPIFILQDAVDQPILDLCWNSKGDTLFLSSQDGTIGLVKFDQNELGDYVKPEINDELIKLSKDHIKPLNHKYESDQPTNSRRSNNPTIELLDSKDAISIKQEDLKNGSYLSKNGSSNGNNNTDSKDVNGSDPLNSNNNVKAAIKPEVIPKPEMKEPEATSSDILHSAMNERQSGASKNSTSGKPITITASSKSSKTATIATTDKQKITTKNGKRRIQPLLISNNGTSESNGHAKASTPSIQTPIISSSSKSLMDFDKASYVVSNDFYKDNKRLKSQDEATATTNKKVKRELEPVKFIGTPILNPNTIFSKLRLAIPKVRFNFQLQSKIENETYVLDIKNGTGNETKPSRITYFKKDKEIWCDFIPRYIQLASEGGSIFWALSTADGQVLIYSHTSGKRIFPPIVLGSPISFLESHGKYLMAVTALGELYVWDIEKKKAELNTSITPLLELNTKYIEDGLSKSDNITLCAVTSAGIPLVTLSNGSGYLYNKDLGIWQTVSESWWSFGSHYWDSNDENIKKPQSSNFFDNEASIIDLLEHKTNEEVIRKTRLGRGKYFNKISKNMLMKEGFESLENAISVSHLENRILCCELLGEFKDFHKYFLTYVQRICELGFKTKLFEVCNELLGPESDDDIDIDHENGGEKDSKENQDKIDWQPVICGLQKHDLLKEVILTCSKHRDAQRILVHFGEKIGVIQEEI